MPGADPVTPVISALFSCWMMPGLDERPEEVEGRGRGGGGSRTPRWSQLVGGHCELLVGLCQGEAALCPPWAPWGGLGGTVPSQSSGLSSPEVFAALSAQVTPPTAPVPALPACHSLQSCPPGDWRCHPAPAPVTPLATAPSQPQNTLGG